LNLKLKESKKMAYLEETWADDVGNIVSTIYEKKFKEPEITTSLIKWDNEGDIDNVFLKLIRDMAVNKEELCYLADNLNSLSEIDILLYKILIIKEEGDYALIAKLLLKVLKTDLTSEQVENTLFRAREWHEMTEIYIEDAVNFLTALKGEKEFAPVPDWVSIQEGENLSLLKTTLPGEGYEASKIKNREFVAQAHDLFHELNQKGMVEGQGIGFSLDEALNSVLSAYSEAENPEQSSSSRVFGPLNRFPDRDCVSNPYANGPCRMLECICREESQPPDEELIELRYNNWFNGKCQVCYRKIKDLSHAVRFPHEGGGWSGCYCSIKCIKDDIGVIKEKINLRLNTMLFSLEDTGIMDRSKI